MAAALEELEWALVAHDARRVCQIEYEQLDDVIMGVVLPAMGYEGERGEGEEKGKGEGKGRRAKEGRSVGLSEEILRPLESMAEEIKEKEKGKGRPVDDLQFHVQRSVRHFLKPANQEETSLFDEMAGQLRVLAAGVALLNSFVQANWTGPSLSSSSLSSLSRLSFLSPPPPSLSLNGQLSDRKMAAELNMDGEEGYPLCRHPLLFLLARYLLVNSSHHLKRLKTGSWWRARVLMTHQKLLEGPSATLYDAIIDAMNKARLELPPLDDDSRAIHIRFNLEYGLIYHFHGDEKAASRYFEKAQEASEFKWNFTGKLGKRTRFQQNDVAQLVVATQSRGAGNEEDSSKKPQELELNDDTLLEKISFSSDDPDPSSSAPLLPIDQAILLAHCLNWKKANPLHGLTVEQMMALVTKSLETPMNWLVHTMGLLIKSRLESDKSRTIERSALQLNALVEQFEDEESNVSERLLFFFALLFPSTWEMNKELGHRYTSFGAYKSALEIFERLELWEDAITCYQGIGKKKQAEELVRTRLASNPSPKFWCLLGDIIEDPSCYQTAWDLSEGHYARAQRSLGSHHFRRQEFQLAAECFERALKINSLFHGIWFCLGCSYTNLGLWDDALNAFHRAALLEADDAETWNNIASIQIKLKRKIDAQRSLKQALKISYDSWKIWENYLYVSMDIGDFPEAIHSFYRILELKNRFVDVEILKILLTVTSSSETKDIYGEPCSRHRPAFVKLMKTITENVTNDPEIWRIYASVQEGGEGAEGAKDGKAKENVLEQLLKAYRSSQVHGWEREPSLFGNAAQSALDVAKAYVAMGDATNVHAAVLLLRNFLKKSADAFEDHPLFLELQNLHNQIKDQ